MSQTLVVLWLGAQAARPAFDADLDAWAQARWVKLAEPAANAPAGLAYDDAIASQVEDLLERARIATGSLDDDTARKRLDDAERSLRAHPELPQSAWLMAEALTVRALVESHAPEGVTTSNALLGRARVLEGERAPAFGATGDDSPPALASVSLGVTGLGGGDRLEWDGAARRLPLVTSAGEHHARVLRGERVVWAGWVTVADGATSVAIPAPPVVPCSRDDIGATRIRGDRAYPAADASCERWAVARPARDGGVEVATCSAAGCGPLLGWKRRYGAVYEGPPQPSPEPGFPTWASVALVGAGAVAFGTFVAWQAGAFDDPAPGRTRWVFYGPSQ
jgi:hypothetical protein